MNHRTGKVAAIVSSVALLGGYVAYQAGAFQLPGAKEGRVQPVAGPASGPATQAAAPAPLMAGSKSKSGLLAPPVDRRMLLSGSKSAGIAAPTPPGEASQVEVVKSPPDRKILMLGSKSAAVFEPRAGSTAVVPAETFTLNPPTTRPAQATLDSPTTRRVLMPGSKSLQLNPKQP